MDMIFKVDIMSHRRTTCLKVAANAWLRNLKWPLEKEKSAVATTSSLIDMRSRQILGILTDSMSL
ncbi:hypothetical protein CHS0354_034918 [Potamilus streckersoni]|uniref:Uncharacterized protein n=1 Tax=Potamilus streckersoni TaxID=2493646 RepID=A0AAE0VUW6_9BIVA|nr:hypothetical protein CHS0354_034918 [Potamilus streckersoni]